MTVSHASRIRIIDNWTHSDVNGITTTSDTKNGSVFDVEFANGSGTNQAQDMFHSQRTVNNAEEDNLDLAGSLVDVFGNTLTLTSIRQLLIVNNATTSGEDLVIGGPEGPSAGALLTDLFDGDNEARIKVKSGGVLCLVAPISGYAITGGSADIIRVYNIGTVPISYDVIIKGTRS